METFPESDAKARWVYVWKYPEADPNGDPLSGPEGFLEMYLSVQGPDGRVLLISKKWVEKMKAAGWHGLDRIPGRCLVDDEHNGQG